MSKESQFMLVISGGFALLLVIAAVAQNAQDSREHLERMKALEVGAEVRKLDGKDYYVIPVEGANDNHIVTPTEKAENE